jgi:hypothetical protein
MLRAWQGIKAGHSLDEMKAKNVVNNMVVSSFTQSFVAIGQPIGASQRILSKGQNMRIQLEDGSSMQWAIVA